MATSRDSPSHRRYSPFIVEEAEIINIDKRNFTADLRTRHTDKEINDVQVLAPYHHFSNGEGIHHLPEVGAKCMVGWPSDNTPPIIMGYKGAASIRGNDDESGGTQRSTTEASGSNTDTSFRSNRPDLLPGDIALTTRDENFIFLRRGGVVQIGATDIAQRVYIPVLNYVKDFAENYEQATFAGDIAWTVSRDEDDPSGNAAGQYIFHMNEFAQDAKATVRVRYTPVGDEDLKTAYDIFVSAQNIDRDTGEVADETYSLSILLDGTKSEFIGAARTVTVAGDDTLAVDGNRTVMVGGDATHDTTGNILLKGAQATLEGNPTFVGAGNATEPAVLGQQLLAWLGTHVHPCAAPGSPSGPPTPLPPPAILSQVVKIK